MANLLSRNRTFFDICLCGLCSVLLDLDHPVAYYLIIPHTGTSYQVLGRFLHIPVAIGCGCVLCLVVAYIGRLWRNERVLRKREADDGRDEP